VPQQMKILITGGFGYLGGRIAQYLANQPSNEIFLGSRQKFNSPYWLPQVKAVQTLWDSPSALEEICRGMDMVIHLSGMNAQDCMNNPVEALNVNAIATARLLRSSILHKIQRFIYFSTAHVYGSPLSGVISEDTCPENLHPYASSHRAGEDVVRGAAQCGEIEGIVLRLSNAFGAPVNKDVNCWMLLVNDCCKQAVMTRQIILHSPGMQRRDFITLSDTARAIEHFIRLPSVKLGNGLFNLGSGQSLRVIDMVEYIAERCFAILGYRPSIILPKENLDEDSQDLDYRIAKLLNIGFQLDGKIGDEVDGTLRFCAENYGVLE
jgi:UDP-glucose 4-epimerase